MCDGSASQHKAPGYNKLGISDIADHFLPLARQATGQSPVSVIGFVNDGHTKRPRRTIVPFQGFGFRVLVVLNRKTTCFAQGRQQFLTEFGGDAVAINGRLELGLIREPVGPVNDATTHHGENAAVFFTLDLIEFAGFQLERFLFAPLSVGPTLALQDIDDDQAGRTTGGDVEFVANFPFARGGRSQVAFIQLFPQSIESAFPAAERLFRRGFRRLASRRRRGRNEDITTDQIVKELTIKLIDQNFVTGGKRREEARLDSTVHIAVSFGQQNGGPHVLAVDFLLTRFRARAKSDELTLGAGQLCLEFFSVGHDTVNAVRCDVRNFDALVLNVGGPAKADVPSKPGFQNPGKRHERFPPAASAARSVRRLSHADACTRARKYPPSTQRV